MQHHFCLFHNFEASNCSVPPTTMGEMSAELFDITQDINTGSANEALVKSAKLGVKGQFPKDYFSLYYTLFLKFL